MRLGFDGTPTPRDSTANLQDGKGAFANSTFAFWVEYAAKESVYAFGVTGSDGRVRSIKAGTNEIETINAISFATSGSRGKVSMWDVAMKGEGFGWSGMRDLTSGPGGPTSSASLLYFGNDINLATSDWAISGYLSFGDFSNSNPSEGAKMTIQLFNAIPSPASAGFMYVSALVAVRRKR